MTKICPSCGNSVEDSLNVCPNCNFTLASQEPSVNDIVEAVTTPIVEEKDETLPSSLEMAFEQLPVIEDGVVAQPITNNINTINSVEEEQNVVNQIEQPVNEVVSELEVPQVQIAVENVPTPETQEPVNMPVQEVVPEIQPEITQVESPVNEFIPEVVVPQVQTVVENVPTPEIPEPVNIPVQEVVPEIQSEIPQVESPVNEVVSEVEVPQVQTVVENVPTPETQEPVNMPAQEVVPEIQSEIPQVESPVNEVVSEVEVPQVQTVVENVPTPETQEPVNMPVQEVVPEIQSEIPQVEQPVNEVIPEVEVPIVSENVQTPEIPEPVNMSVQEVVPEKQSEMNSIESDTSNNIEDTKQTISSTAVLDSNTVIDVPEGIEEVSINDIVNNDLESVSVQVEEEPEETALPIEKVVLPEATIGEIDPNVLTTIYEQEEKKNENNKELLAKEEEERKRREEEALIAKKKMEPKPDLMARVDYVVADDKQVSNKKSKNKKSFLPKFIIILLLILICAGLCWFFLFKGNKLKEETYETTIRTYYKNIEKNDKNGVLSTYVPCTSKSEEVINEVDTKLSTYKKLGKYKVEYKINSVEMVNEEDQNSIKTNNLGTYCGIDSIPNITDYKHIYISQTLITDERTTTDLELFIVQIEDKWYIVPIIEKP